MNVLVESARPMLRALVAVALLLGLSASAAAQQNTPRLGSFVVDLRGTFPNFPADEQLAESRGYAAADLPGLGLGVQVGVHVYVFRWRALTVGVGGEAMAARARSAAVVVAGQVIRRAITERFTTIAPQLSFNFGGTTGWSYVSAGIGPSVWSIVASDALALPADDERLKTLNYGGGARWFAKKHVAFTFDVRFYAMNPGTPSFGFPGSPRTTLLVIGAGASIR